MFRSILLCMSLNSRLPSSVYRITNKQVLGNDTVWNAKVVVWYVCGAFLLVAPIRNSVNFGPLGLLVLARTFYYVPWNGESAFSQPQQDFSKISMVIGLTKQHDVDERSLLLDKKLKRTLSLAGLWGVSLHGEVRMINFPVVLSPFRFTTTPQAW